MPSTSTVSFTVRPPPSTSATPFKTPAFPRRHPLHSPNDSDDDGETGIVFANGGDGEDVHTDSQGSDGEHDFMMTTGSGDRRSEQKKKQKKKKDEQGDPDALVIPSKPNPDWREAARKRRAHALARGRPSFIPDSALAKTGKDGSVGGLGTRDTINSGPRLEGLQVMRKAATPASHSDESHPSVDDTEPKAEQTNATMDVRSETETEDERALRAVLAGQSADQDLVDAIHVPIPLSETDALRQDVEFLPDVASADDYARVPVSAFGAAMLRGMGWTDGGVGKGVGGGKRGAKGNAGAELYLPQARPALLGIGAKERDVDVDEGARKKKRKGEEMRYVPVVRQGSGSRSGTVSRRGSRSPSRREREDRVDERERRRERDRDRDRDRDDDDRRRRDYDRERRDRDRQRDRSRERDRRR